MPPKTPTPLPPPRSKEEVYWKYVRRCEHCGELIPYVSGKRIEVEWRYFTEVVTAMSPWANCPHCKLRTRQTTVATDPPPSHE